MLAHARANALIISGLIDLFVKSISCLAEVFIYRKIDLFLREFFFFPPHQHSFLALPVSRPQETHCTEDTGRSGQV